MSSWLSSPKHSPTSTHRQPSPQPPKSPGWGSRAINMSDKVGGVLNTYADKLGIETFWPTTGDMPREMEKAARILKHFTSASMVWGFSTSSPPSPPEAGRDEMRVVAGKARKLGS